MSTIKYDVDFYQFLGENSMNCESSIYYYYYTVFITRLFGSTTKRLQIITIKHKHTKLLD